MRSGVVILDNRGGICTDGDFKLGTLVFRDLERPDDGFIVAGVVRKALPDFFLLQRELVVTRLRFFIQRELAMKGAKGRKRNTLAFQRFPLIAYRQGRVCK